MHQAVVIESSLSYTYSHLCFQGEGLAGLSKQHMAGLSKQHMAEQFGRILENPKALQDGIQSFCPSSPTLSEEAFITFCRDNLSHYCRTSDRGIDLEHICWRVTLGRESRPRSCSEHQRDTLHCQMDEEVQFNLWRLFVRLSKGKLILSREHSFWLSQQLNNIDLPARIYSRGISLYDLIGSGQTFQQITHCTRQQLACPTFDAQQECLHLLQSLINEVSERILKQGYLTKRGHVRHNWLKRWMVLYPTELRYYSSPSKDKLLGVCHISHQSRLRHIGGESSHDHRFMLICGVTGKQFELSASSESEKEEWVQYLSFCFQHRITTLEHLCSKIQTICEVGAIEQGERSSIVVLTTELTQNVELWRDSCKGQIFRDFFHWLMRLWPHFRNT